MDSILLNKHRTAKYDYITMWDIISLAQGRLHECAGRARRSFALMLAAKTRGPVIWISATYSPDQLNPAGIESFVDPGRFLFIKISQKEDMLWTMEEALRSGAVELIVADLPYFPALSPIRRLQLAAEAGSELGMVAPLGLILTPNSGGAQGVETRWTLQPNAQGFYAGWFLSRIKSRGAPPKTWCIMQTPENSFEIAK